MDGTVGWQGRCGRREGRWFRWEEGTEIVQMGAGIGDGSDESIDGRREGDGSDGRRLR